MLSTNSDYNSGKLDIEGVLDVGPIVIAHITNPVQHDMIKFIKEIFDGKRRILMPLSIFVGAYHILTQYLKVSRSDAKSALYATLKLRSPLLYPKINKNQVLASLDFAAIYNIESWDAYLISLGKSLGTRNFYTIDKKLKKILEINVISPLPAVKITQYHQWLRDNIFASE
ncbi:MAG: type II toxin-antitoxin system VapC family toxin [Promethearchaeota archaeon]